jgi:hypothetical protein
MLYQWFQWLSLGQLLIPMSHAKQDVYAILRAILGPDGSVPGLAVSELAEQ